MKRYFITDKYKDIQIIVFNRNLRRRKNQLKRRKKENNFTVRIERKRFLENLHERQGELREYPKSLKPRNKKKFKTITFPENFSLINNHNEILDYFNKVRTAIDNKHQVTLDLSLAQQMTPDAIAFLLSSISDKSFNRGMEIRGTSPNNPKLARMLWESGFFEHVQSKAPKIVKDKKNMLLHNLSEKKVEPLVAKNATDISTLFTFEQIIKFKPIYEILIECMANTHNHANINKRGYYDWWIFVYNDIDKKITSFAFIDLGVGIFGSLAVKEYKKVFFVKVIKENYELVEDLLNGKISSRTKLLERGKGFPLINKHSKNQYIKNFRIMSNDVYADLDKKEYLKMDYNFKGTLLYWELHNNQENGNIREN